MDARTKAWAIEQVRAAREYLLSAQAQVDHAAGEVARKGWRHPLQARCQRELTRAELELDRATAAYGVLVEDVLAAGFATMGSDQELVWA